MRPSDFTVKFYQRMRAMPIAFTCLVCLPVKRVTLNAPLKCFNKAIAIKLDYPEALYHLGLAYQDQGQVAEAAASYERAPALTPDYAKAANNLGNALRDQGRLAEAVNSCWITIGAPCAWRVGRGY
jgi:tetratricopeptide (TPR) repeat protein